MVHIIEKVDGGYKVRDKVIKGKKHYYSLNPLSLSKAKKQLIAISLSLLKNKKHKTFNEGEGIPVKN